MSLGRNLSKAAAVAGGLAPTGVVLPFAGATAPTDWLLCYGQAVSRTTYSALFAAIGTAYGAGDGSTTFNVPDLRGRVPGGKDNMGGSAASRLTTAGSGVDGATLGAAGGAESHTLTAAQIPAHTHPLTNAAGAGGNYALGGSGYGYPTASNTSSNTGGGGAHPNAQPTLVLSYIIKA